MSILILGFFYYLGGHLGRLTWTQLNLTGQTYYPVPKVHSHCANSCIILHHPIYFCWLNIKSCVMLGRVSIPSFVAGLGPMHRHRIALPPAHGGSTDRGRGHVAPHVVPRWCCLLNVTDIDLWQILGRFLSDFMLGLRSMNVGSSIISQLLWMHSRRNCGPNNKEAFHLRWHVREHADDHHNWHRQNGGRKKLLASWATWKGTLYNAVFGLVGANLILVIYIMTKWKKTRFHDVSVHQSITGFLLGPRRIRKALPLLLLVVKSLSKGQVL